MNKHKYNVKRNENKNPEGDGFWFVISLRNLEYDRLVLSVIRELNQVINLKLGFEFPDDQTIELFGSFIVNSLWYMKNRYVNITVVGKIEREYFNDKIAICFYDEEKNIIDLLYIKDQSNTALHSIEIKTTIVNKKEL